MTRLMLTFVNGSGNRVTLSVPEPKSTLTEIEVAEAMDDIVDADIIKPKGESLVAPYMAKVVDSNTTVLYRPE